MKPETPDSNELLRRVRQQLILAQVRIMDLEDERDGLTSQLGESEERKIDAQSLADENSDLSRNLKRSIEDYSSRLAEATQRVAHLENELNELLEQSETQQKELKNLSNKLTETTHLNDGLNARIVTLQNSRSWRWTTWLRSLGL